MSNAGVVLQVDNDALQYSGAWAIDTQPQFFGGSSQLGSGSFSYTFTGKSIAFTGTSPPAGITSNFSVTIDDTTSDAHFNTSLPALYGQWYQSPELADGEHTITVSDLEKVGVDYALVTSTNPQDRSDVVVDDSDSSLITYSGNWSKSAALHSNTSQVLPSSSFGSGTHDGLSENSSFSLSFSGAEVTIYLVLRRSVVGNLRATVDVDGQTLDRISIWTTASGDDRPNYPVFTSHGLSSDGAHVLTMNITEVSGDQMFSLDYLSFTNATQSPDGSPPAATIATASGAAATGTQTSTSLQTSFSTDTAAPDGQGVKTPNVGAIVGGVIGGLFAVVALILILWWLRRRRQREVNKLPTLVPYPSQIQVSPSSFGSDAPMLPSTRSSETSRRSRRKHKETMARVRLEVERLKLEMGALDSGSGSTSQVEALKKKIDDLSAENSRLQRALAGHDHPPAYV